MVFNCSMVSMTYGQTRCDPVASNRVSQKSILLLICIISWQKVIPSIKVGRPEPIKP